MAERIDLIVADIDGCVTGGGRAPLDLDLMRQIVEWNEASKTDDKVPAIVFNTGRPLPYIVALKQAAGCYLPSIAEFGALIWCPENQLHYLHPEYSPGDRQQYNQLLAEAEEMFENPEDGILIEAGKLCQLTLYPKPPITVADLWDRIETLRDRWGNTFTIDRTQAVINFMPRNVNKGTALDWLADRTGIPTSRMAGIGDSDSDWLFMERCGINASPKNASEFVRDQSQWKLDSGPAECIYEFVKKVIRGNG